DTLHGLEHLAVTHTRLYICPDKPQSLCQFAWYFYVSSRTLCGAITCIPCVQACPADSHKCHCRGAARAPSALAERQWPLPRVRSPARDGRARLLGAVAHARLGWQARCSWPL